MRQGWSTEAIQDAISEVALASWWLSGEAVNWGYDPIMGKASHTLVAFLHTTPAKIEAIWQQRLQQAQQAQRPGRQLHHPRQHPGSRRHRD